MQNALFFLTLVCLPLLSFAQKQNSVVLEAKLIQGISKLIENNQTVPLAELNEQLKQAVGKKVKIPKVPSFVFDPRSLYELCKPSTLIVSKVIQMRTLHSLALRECHRFPADQGRDFCDQLSCRCSDGWADPGGGGRARKDLSGHGGSGRR